MALEIVPAITLADFKTMKLTRLSSDVTDAEVDEGMQRLAEQSKPYAAKAEGAKAEKDDRVMISFAGTIDGKPFEGGSGDDAAVGNRFEHFHSRFRGSVDRHWRGRNAVQLKVKFPEHYQAEHLAGKDAEFVVAAKSVETPGTLYRRRRIRQVPGWIRSPNCARP